MRTREEIQAEISVAVYGGEPMCPDRVDRLQIELLLDIRDLTEEINRRIHAANWRQTVKTPEWRHSDD